MASEQTRARKKKSRNLTEEEHYHQVLYRHQHCIPNPKFLQSCEKHRLFGLKNNKESDFVNKLASSEELNNLKTRQVNTNPKNVRRLEKDIQETELSLQTDDTERHNEELSKSRKRRIRKRRLFTSLAPSLRSTSNPSLPVERTPQTKSLSSTCHASSVLSLPLTNNNDSDLSKTSPKNSRKRSDKSVGSRNKSIKSKTLVDCTNQSKSEIIKSIEEKTLNSLLQTLAPLTNSSPKKEKISTTPLFSFPEKRLSSGDTKVDKDGVFYFGETKHQLEKLTSELNKCSTSAQSNQINKSSFSVNKLNNTENCAIPFNFSPLCNDIISTLSTVTQHINSTDLSSTNIENKKLFSFGSSDLSSKELAFKPPHQSDPSQSPNQKSELSQPVSCTSLTSVTSDKVSSDSNIIVSENIKTYTEKSQHLCDTGTSSVRLAAELLAQKDTKKNQIIMKSTDETMKSNKTREEILLEREAKKAAKLAARAKNKTEQVNKVADNDSKKTKSSEIVKHNNKETINNENKKIEFEIASTSLGNDPHIKTSNDNKLATSDHVAISLNIEVIQNKKPVESSKDVGKDVSSKSKAELKAERRAKQESQRAAKALSNTVQPQKETLKEEASPLIRNEPSKIDAKSAQNEKKQDVTKTTTQPKPKLFSHLYQEKSPVTTNQIMKLGGLHPAIVQLGVQYATRVVVGSNARCVALLHALKQMIKDYSTPSEKDFSRGLEEELGPVMIYLNRCRPLAVSMTNALRHIKRSLIQLPNTVKDVEARRKMCDLVDTYIHEQIDVAGEAISDRVELKIANGDVILTYGCSSLVCQILVESHLKGKKFRVIVVDGLPWQEGREMLRRLVDKGLSCTYVLISAASFIMREASKVLLGAHALLANGYVMSRAGSSQVALLAHCYNVPVLVCCETHKFCERVQTDAFVYNELGELCCDNIKDKDNSRVISNLTPLSLAYDITPPDLVSAVVTERAILPCTSVPVILRIKPSESVM